MESATTSFSTLAGASVEGHSKNYLSDGSDSGRQNSVDHNSPSGSGESDSWKNNSYYDNPLHAAVSAVLNVASGENGNEAAEMQAYANYQQQIKQEKDQLEHQQQLWRYMSGKRDHLGDGKISLTDLANSYLSHSNGEDLGKRHSEEGVLRANIVKMESSLNDYHHQQHEQQQQQHSIHTSVLTSLHSSIPSQHVEVIQKVGGGQHQPLGHHLSPHDLSPKQNDGEQSVLQVMEKMQVPSYDPSVMYQRQQMYNKIPSVYETLGSAGQYGLAGLPSTQHLLPAAYPSLLASNQEYYISQPRSQAEYYSTRPLQGMYQEGAEELLERLRQSDTFARQGPPQLFKPVTVDLPSPVDSGIGQEIMVTPKQENGESVIHSANYVFTYTDLQQSVVTALKTAGKDYTPRPPPATDRHIMSGRDSPLHIPKIITSLGFQYTLEAPISTSVRKDDDKMTYINKGQFYTVTLQYIPDALKPLRSSTVKEKTPEEEAKCWQFWHTRQHSAKQRILDVDMKNSSGIIGGIDEIAHNAVQFYWSTQDQPAKVNVAVQCLSTDFSNQKGVKGLPLHIQIDTYDESQSKTVPFHRGYCQIKVFCDKGANRKMLHEQRREEKRKLTGRKKSDGDYHEASDRSEFYHMSNLNKPAVLFVPPEDYERTNDYPPMETFYGVNDPNVSQSLVKEEDEMNSEDGSTCSPTPKKAKIYPSERVMIYVRKPEEQIFTPLHLIPPTVEGMIFAICEKYNTEKEKIAGVYKRCAKGITVKIDDDMVRHYCDEDTFIMDISQAESESETYNVTLIETTDVSVQN